MNGPLRSTLIAISRAAKNEGECDFQLHPRTVKDWKRPRKAATNGQATAPMTPQSRSFPVVLRGPKAPPIVGGISQAVLTKAEYDVIEAVVAAYPNRLSKDDLEIQSGRGDARKIFGRISKKSKEWTAALYLPGAKRGGYGLNSNGKNPH